MPNSKQQISIIYSKQTTELKEKTIQKRKKQTNNNNNRAMRNVHYCCRGVRRHSFKAGCFYMNTARSQSIAYFFVPYKTLRYFTRLFCRCRILFAVDRSLNTCFDVIARFLVSDICNVCLRWFLLSIKGITLKANLREHALRYLNVTFNLKVRFNFLSLWALLQNKAHSINRIQRIMSFKGNYG